MSRHSSLDRVVTINDNPEGLEIIREEQFSPAMSSYKMNAKLKETAESEEINEKFTCLCTTVPESIMDDNEIERIILEKERQLKIEFEKNMEKQITNLKERFDFILQNEQIRTSYMLREAHRERQEKISALQTQLECKNLAGLMYVICSERRKSKLEKLRIIEEYTNYIHALQDILTNSQDLVLNLSRGYKTTAKVNNEWREKMKEIIKEFQAYIYHFNGGTPETNQYLFDLPQLLTIDSPLKDNPLEDPCEDEEKLEYEKPPIVKSDQPWWEQLEGDCKPFVMFGDMADFQPPQRRAVLKAVKAANTAPMKWKSYVFNNMWLHSSCENADVIKGENPKRLAEPVQWECHDVQTIDQQSPRTPSYTNHRRLTASVDIRGNMGSILKIITSNAVQPSPSNRPNLLAARDSMEIASTTRLRVKNRLPEYSEEVTDVEKSKEPTTNPIDLSNGMTEQGKLDTTSADTTIDEEEGESKSVLGSIHHDSLELMSTTRKPSHDHKIHYEKVCPMEKCQRLQVDSFIRSLPPYMRDSPFMNFEQTYEDYEPCSPEQLEILRQRISEKTYAEKLDVDESPLAEWTTSVLGIGCQTSELDLELPPCTCKVPAPTPEDSEAGNIFKVEDLFPVKQAIDQINKQCFFNDHIDFDRFKVIGQESSQKLSKNKEEFTRTRMQEIRKILKKHPSLCDMFQANTGS